MISRQASLEGHIKKLAMGWAIAGLSLTIGLCLSIFYWLPFKDIENQIKQQTTSVISARRTDILSGEVLTVELQLKSELGLKQDEQIVFLDANMNRWITDQRDLKLKPCQQAETVCRDYFHQKVIYYSPIYFDKEKTSLWGYLYVEKNPTVNWPMVLSVVLAILIGMSFQTIGYYVGLSKAIAKVGKTLRDWSQKLSLNPKNRTNYTDAPFSEIGSIELALARLRGEIDDLYALAKKEGALETLRSVGHDILNPVSRIKRIIGLMKSENIASDQELLNNLNANARRLSNYAEQLKYLYKKEIGEEQKINAVNASQEIESLVEELKFHPEVLDKKIKFSSNIEPKLYISIPVGALGRLVENLCTNSVQASHDQGLIEILVTSEVDRMAISILDNGHGIPDEIKSEIFSPGYTSRPNQGTGLGLFVVKQICD